MAADRRSHHPPQLVKQEPLSPQQGRPPV
jgi:hypothetical protein